VSKHLFLPTFSRRLPFSGLPFFACLVLFDSRGVDADGMEQGSTSPEPLSNLAPINRLNPVST
jgi:hypothetical protein